MPLILPVRGPDAAGLYLDQRVRVQIDNQYYAFRYRYNSFEDAWYCYIGLLGQDPRVKFKLVNGLDLLLAYKAYDEVPKGMLLLVDVDEEWGRPSKNNMYRDGRFFLLFVSDNESLEPFAGMQEDAI